jgi:miniconductance mechanosensitive channel
MNTSEFLSQLQSNVSLALSVVVFTSIVLFLLARNVIARGLMNLAARTSSKVDDILVRHLNPVRMAWLAPLALIYTGAALFPDYAVYIEKAALFFILWLTVLTFNSLLNAINDIYESRPSYNGVSIQSYLDIVKIAAVLMGIILTVTLVTDDSPIVLLTGLGALAAVLMLIFQNTILSLVASIQIAANDLLKEGDWVEVPSYEADGDVMNINLHTIKIRNFDLTYTIIPTYRIVEVPYRNWRGMTESGGRRIQRSLLIDQISIKFCDQELLERLCRIDLLHDYMQEKTANLAAYRAQRPDTYDFPLDGPQVTNIEVFRAYINAYLRSRPDIFTERMPFLVRVLAPTPMGLPVELYVFAKTTEWEKYEMIQAEIFDHLLAAAPNFDLRVFQQPTGLDFAAFAAGANGAARSLPA